MSDDCSAVLEDETEGRNESSLRSPLRRGLKFTRRMLCG